MNKNANLLIALADRAMAISGDFHMLHLNYEGPETDTFHRQVLKTYYEQLADDYDSLAELAACWDEYLPNPNESATRIGYTSYNKIKGVRRDESVEISHKLMANYVIQLANVFRDFDEMRDDPIAIGATNWLQGRIEYWSKELCYFNRRRST